MKEIEELFRKLRHHYRLFLKGSNDSFIKMNEIETDLLSRLKRGEKYKLFFESCSCLFAEGVEFMTKTEIYEAIKKEVKKLEGEP